MSIRMSVPSADGKLNLFAERRTVEATEDVPGHDVIALSHKNGRGGERPVGDFRVDDFKALAKAL